MHAFALELQWELGGWCGPFGWNGKKVGGGTLDPAMEGIQFFFFFLTFSWGVLWQSMYGWTNII